MLSLTHGKSSREAIAWWELRRIPFNIAVGVAGLLTVAIMLVIGSLVAAPGEDAVEPVVLIVGVAGYAVAANVLYTLGWITELLWTEGDTSRSAAYRGRIFRLGLACSIGLTLLPGVVLALLWGFFGNVR